MNKIVSTNAERIAKLIKGIVSSAKQKETEISDYAYERTLMMEQRSEIIKRLNVTSGTGGSGGVAGGTSAGPARRQSLLLEQEVDGRLIKFRIRKPSTCDFEETIPFVCSPAGDPLPAPSADSPIVGSLGSSGASQTGAGPTSAGDQQQPGSPGSTATATGANPLLSGNLRPDEANVRRMHTALSLNEAILRRSKSSKLVIINLPGAPKESTPEAENNCKYY